MTYWKYIIIGLLGGMMLFHFTALYFIRNQRYELTSPDYYEREIQHEQTLQAIREGQALNWQLNLDSSNHKATLQVRNSDQEGIALEQVTLHLYRPHNSSEDQLLQLKPTETTGIFTAPIKAMGKGRWNILITATHEGKDLAYQEKSSMP